MGSLSTPDPPGNVSSCSCTCDSCCKSSGLRVRERDMEMYWLSSDWSRL